MMDLLLNRFRNLLVLVIAVIAQLVLLAYQVKSNQEIRLVRVWAVTAVTPAANVIETVRSGTAGFFRDYFYLLDVRDENRRVKAELGRLKLENQFLKSELSTADRARALAQFQTRTPSRTTAARIIGNSTGANSKVVYIDRGTTSGVERGMAVITPDGIVGKIVESFPTAAQVLLITDPTFAAGVISQTNRTKGTLKGEGKPACIVSYVQNEEKVDVGEWFYTTGDDRVFPKGLPVGQVTTVRPGRGFKEIFVTPSGFQNGFDEVLVVLEGAHQPIPEPKAASQELHMLPPPPPDGTTPDPAGSAQPVKTDADTVLERYQRIQQVEGLRLGTRGSPVPNFNINPDDARYRKAAADPAVPETTTQGAAAPGGAPAQTQPAAPAPRPNEQQKQD
jgi:rod shape-determining protein MreC